VDIPSFTTFLNAIKADVPAVTSLVTALMFLTGMILLFRAVYALKLYGELRTMTSSSAELKGPLVLFLVGTILLFYPSLFSVSLSSVFGTNNILSYAPNPSDTANEKAMFHAVGIILQLVGLIAFFRGWLQIQSLSGHAQQGTFGKGLTHIIGGILLINIFATWNIIKSALGWG
jgi:intracellular multiplication protein IcmC